MLRWREALVLALLAAACGDGGASAPLAGEVESDGGLEEPFDAGPAVAVILPAPDVGASDAAATLDPQTSVDEAEDAGEVDAAMRLAATEVLPIDDGLGAADACGDAAPPLAVGLQLRELAIYQAVKIPLYKDGAWVSARNAPVVQNRKALLRAFVDLESDYKPHAVRGALVLDNAGKISVLTAERALTRASSDDVADSTFDFTLDAALIGPQTKLSVSLLETSCTATTNAGARLPVRGRQTLSAEATGTLRVVIVPVTLDGRTPDVGEAQLSRVREAMQAYYPVADVAVSAHAPITWDGTTVTASGIGWSELLSRIGRLRQEDAAAANVYYFGWITPTDSFRTYCRAGCVMGLAPQNTVVSRPNQIGLGVGFVDPNTYTTVVHELGHAHGLPHAPCAPHGGTIEGADTKFPYTDAKIGVWGWDPRSAKLLAPSGYADVMSYCEPTWISDYNYQKLATRSKAVNTTTYVLGGTKGAKSWQGVILYADGSARFTGMTVHELPGEPSAAQALDERGRSVDELEVVRVPLSDDAQSFLYLPELDPSWVTIDLGDRVLRLDEIAPAL